MPKTFQKIFLFVTALALLSCQSSSASKPENWSGDMQELATAFEDLIPILYDTQKFQNPTNKSSVETKIKNFSERIHHIHPDKAQNLYGNDPLMLKGLENLKEVAGRSLANFKMGRTLYSQRLLQQSARYCFQCHTRTPSGPEHMYWQNFQVEKFNLEAHEKAQVYVAMRQYDKAKEALQTFINKGHEDDGLTLLREQDMKYYMLIAVRGQSNFTDAQRLVTQELKNEKLSPSFRGTLTTWKKDLAKWQKQFATTSPTLESAKKVLGAKATSVENYKDADLIKALVGATLLHESLRHHQDKKKQSETYFLLGKIYDSFEVGGFWDLSDLYLEMCIETFPHSSQAVNCYQRLKDSMIIKNSGSSQGVALSEPEDVYLQRLQTLAAPEKKTK